MTGNSQLIFSQFHEGKDSGLCFAAPVFINGLVSVGTLVSMYLEKVPVGQETKDLK